MNLRLSINPNRAAACAVALAPLFYFLPALLRGRVLCPDDGLLQNTPFRVAAANIIKSGHLPLWNPYIFSGMPLFATAQVGILYPLNWFYLPFSTTTATNLMVISTYVVAGLGAYLYARQIGGSIAGAMITGFAWQFGGATIGQLSHINIVQTSALLPWVLWSIERYGDKSTIKRGALISVFLAVQFFAGHQQAFVNSLLLISVYVIVMAIANRGLRKRYLTCFAFIATGLLLAAIQILPTYELLRRSERSAATYEFFTSFSMPKRFILAFVAPYIMGGGDGRLFRAPYVGPPFYAEMAGYVGVIAIMLAVIALVIKPDLRAKFWAVVAVICLLLAFGGYAPLYLYKLIYQIPLLNLFRVPARHLMEVDFALAVLAGRGFTVLYARRGEFRIRLIVGLSVLAVLLFTLIAITILRPVEFHLARAVPPTFLRSPELFIPMAIATISTVAIWLVVSGKRRATAIVIGVLLIDLTLWGQSSGWYPASPRTRDEYFEQPEVMQALARVATADKSSYRVLTAPHEFNPAEPPVPPSVSHSPNWVLWTQPDVYMMHGIPNAAGYDGFGLERYSQLAGRMKVWGELTDPDSTLRGDSREIDLVNVRYLVSMRKQSAAVVDTFARAGQRYGDYSFAANDLGLPNLGPGKRLTFSTPPVDVDRLALVTHLAWSESIPDDTPVAQVRLRLADGGSLVIPLRAGVDTSEWSYDRPDIQSRIRHRRATVANSYPVADAQGNYEGHSYVTALALPHTATVTGGEIVLLSDSKWSPDLSLNVFRISLINQHSSKIYPLERRQVSIDNADAAVPSSTKSTRWNLLTETKYVDIYENANALPRAWLASQARRLDEEAMLKVIREGRFADGSKWDPATTALIESPLRSEVRPGTTAESRIAAYEPNRIDVNTKSDAPSVLILSENHYPGWRTYVDGQFAETLRVDYNLRGVELPAGEHTVAFIYRPKSFVAGFVISALTLLALLALQSGRLQAVAQRTFAKESARTN